MNGIDFDDHIILNESEHYSFFQHNLIDKMKDKYRSLFSSDDLYVDNLKNKRK